MKSLPQHLCDYTEEDQEYCVQYLMDNFTLEELAERIGVVRSQQQKAFEQQNEMASNDLEYMANHHIEARMRKATGNKHAGTWAGKPHRQTVKASERN